MDFSRFQKAAKDAPDAVIKAVVHFKGEDRGLFGPFSFEWELEPIEVKISLLRLLQDHELLDILLEDYLLQYRSSANRVIDGFGEAIRAYEKAGFCLTTPAIPFIGFSDHPFHVAALVHLIEKNDLDRTEHDWLLREMTRLQHAVDQWLSSFGQSAVAEKPGETSGTKALRFRQHQVIPLKLDCNPVPESENDRPSQDFVVRRIRECLQDATIRLAPDAQHAQTRVGDVRLTDGAYRQVCEQWWQARTFKDAEFAPIIPLQVFTYNIGSVDGEAGVHIEVYPGLTNWG